MLDLTIIILNYNTPDLVQQALFSIQKFYFPTSQYETEVVVVDNGSSDSTIQEVVARFPKTQLLKLPKNVGFAAGNNAALKKAHSRYVMLMNSDTEFTAESSFNELLAYMDAQPEIAICTPKLQLSNGKMDMASHRGEPTPWASFTYFSGLEKMFPNLPFFGQYHQTFKNFEQIHEIDACSGAAMVVRSEAIEKVGLLDERFFMYAEDLDWCKRFRDASYKVVYFPQSLIIHHKYKSGRNHQDKVVAKKTSHFFYDTMLQYYDKHYQKKYPFFVRPLIQLFIYIQMHVLS